MKLKVETIGLEEAVERALIKRFGHAPTEAPPPPAPPAPYVPFQNVSPALLAEIAELLGQAKRGDASVYNQTAKLRTSVAALAAKIPRRCSIKFTPTWWRLDDWQHNH